MVNLPVGHWLRTRKRDGVEYEHRVVMAIRLGRRLLGEEHVHHKNGVRDDNRLENLELCPDKLHHYAAHHRYSTDCRRVVRLPGEPNLEVECACGCGGMILRYDHKGRVRRFLPSHNAKTPEHKAKMPALVAKRWSR